MLFDLRSRRRRRVDPGRLRLPRAADRRRPRALRRRRRQRRNGRAQRLEQNGDGSASGIKLDYTAMSKAQTHRQARTAQRRAAWDSYALPGRSRCAETNYVTTSTSAGFTTAGAKELQVVKRAWNHYLALTPANPDPTLAAEVVVRLRPAAGHPGLEDRRRSGRDRGQRPIPRASPSTSTLALYAYLAKDKTTGRPRRGTRARRRTQERSQLDHLVPSPGRRADRLQRCDRQLGSERRHGDDAGARGASG